MSHTDGGKLPDSKSSDSKSSNGKSSEGDAAQRGPGRPPVLDDANKRLLCTLLSAGCSRVEAVRFVGCAINTLKRAAERDPAFAVQLKQAEVGREILELDKVRRASDRSWRASAWLLKHYNPRRFNPGRRDVYTHEQVLKIVRSAGNRLSSPGLGVDLLRDSRDRLQAVLDELSTREGIRRYLKDE